MERQRRLARVADVVRGSMKRTGAILFGVIVLLVVVATVRYPSVPLRGKLKSATSPAGNAAMRVLAHVESEWRGVTEVFRWAYPVP